MSEQRTLLLEYELDSLYRNAENISVSSQLQTGYTNQGHTDIPAGLVGYTNTNFAKYKDPSRGYPTLLFSVMEHMVNMQENMVDLNAELGLSFQMDNSAYNAGLIDAHVSQRVDLSDLKVQDYSEKLIIRQVPFDSMLESIRVSDEKYMSLVDYIAYKLPNLDEIELIQTNLDPQYAKDFLCKVLMRLRQRGTAVSLDISKAVCSDYAGFFDGLSIYGGVKEFAVRTLTITDVQLFSVLYQVGKPWFEGIPDLRVIGINGFKMSKPFVVNLRVNLLTLDVSNCEDIHKTFYKYLATIGSNYIVLSVLVKGGQFTPASVEILKNVYVGMKEQVYAFNEIAVILGFKDTGNSEIVLNGLVSPAVLNRVLFIKIYDDLQDIYMDKNKRYVVHTKGALTGCIVSPKTYNVLARSSMLNNQSMLIVNSGISIVLVNNDGYSVDYRHLAEK